MSLVRELFGNYSKRNDINWGRVIAEQLCPYSGKSCYKVRKSEPSISIGVCTVEYGGCPGIMICPNRMLERQQIFNDCLHLLTMHEPGNELHLLPEVSIPGGSVDYFLISARGLKVIDFVGIELQTLDTTGSIWSERSALVQSKGVTVNKDDLSKKNFGMNWKMSAKTILVQMHHKIDTFENLNKHLVLVIQDCFYDYMAKEFNFAPLRPALLGDSFHIHSYSLDDNQVALRIRLSDRKSTDSAGLSLSLGLQAEAKVDLEEIVEYLERRMSDTTLLRNLNQIDLRYTYLKFSD
ncbi:MAG: hypothetical protein LBL86_11000 [Coriobacteriales bacterium]|jgi:hypothetical protein|nr:hypothetical protein [Coriobacteriales bacterium]